MNADSKSAHTRGCVRFFSAGAGAQPCDGGAQCPGRGFSDMPGPRDWSHEGIDYAVSHLSTRPTPRFLPPGR